MSKIIDCHCHTCNSPDCESAPEELCRMALSKGLGGIAFTDHCNVNHWPDTDVLSIVRASVSNAEEMQKRFKGKLTVLRGVELGNHVFNGEIVRQVLELCDYDMVIGSVHAIKYKEWNGNIARIDFSTFTDNLIRDYLDVYFGEILRMVSEEDIDVIAHFSFGVRYICYRGERVIDITDYLDVVDLTLKRMIERSIALEINANNVVPRKKIGGQVLVKNGNTLRHIKIEDIDFEIAKRYYELGGRLITLGSDSHSPERVGRAFDEIITRLKEIGFDKGCYFQNRKVKTYRL